ncbi:MAG: hypothetical protein CMA88_03125, partial [Euryarchaeota archaeon]|nr:hypothetical protein [Euryarchaeota archaeon]
MADINFHPDDRVMSGTEVVKNVGFSVAIIMVFEVMFLAHASEGGLGLFVACGIPMGLIGVMILGQSVMHFLGRGTMVMNEGSMILRTPRSGKKRGKSFLDPLERAILSPITRLIMRDIDKDGDGRLSFKELLGEMGDVSKSEYLEMQELFEKHDKDHDGYLTPSEL